MKDRTGIAGAVLGIKDSERSGLTCEFFAPVDRSAFHNFLHVKTAEQRQMIRHVRFDISDPSTLDWWLHDAQNLLVAYTKGNTLHLTVGVKKSHARHWPHPEASYLAKYVLSADPDLYQCTAEFNIEVEDHYGGIFVITAEEIKKQIRLRK
ncbi:MAG: hypothetical protein OHK93_001121 [Ramalina farinacea]|uniref:Uncharacterized protein n=1 Tax=Ramalina farinacea TaxID=258253 RepID=A0AA43QPU8_9LECA|nr:hypothetical protein [Ramalina farinacea]